MIAKRFFVMVAAMTFGCTMTLFAPASASASATFDGPGAEGESGVLITGKMQVVRNAIQASHGPFTYGIGCDRPDPVGDHGVGRACDFFVSPGGRAATGSLKTKGDQVAAHAIRLPNVSHVIWNQRIYNRSDPGWRPMADRGSVTANHRDHVHVSVKP